VSGSYGVIVRNDGDATYILLTDADDPYGDYNSLRPFAIKNSTGTCNISGNAATATKAYINNDTSSKIYVLGATSTGNQSIYRESSVYMSSNVLYGAAWNDYAEYRESNIDNKECGYVLIEDGNNDRLMKSTERLQPFAGVSSDTYGFAIGKTEKANTPIAVTGRVLVHTYEDRNEFAAGDCVCSGPDGKVSKMTREEVIQWPDRIVGTVSCVPEYEYWKDENESRAPVKVDGRIWIKVR
jgi:hypothetical protein